ncbi:DUF2612 domain-containing protein [Burkholderia sp. FERM BP-3421]|jgi:hypothetical protein|uniref:DUF2612 domain-containing protein n=1 Tax=Burkholderia sp. FERM BP-3421 TaxID=1494466 RepID=UPI00235DC6D1|nr:DUF2612 domain-containing protein [Burkholderia sp. FERM BP-3421]WDD92780.1 DUF2612 domain-containing protein [Burkholderia sp. FERM BP-3421]
MAELEEYIGLITSEHRERPRFSSTVGALVGPLVEQLNAIGSMPEKFDLDVAKGVQLDAIGMWVGVSRRINAQLANVYFSFDLSGIGYDQGIWKGPYDPDMGLVMLDDDTYRLVIRAKIGANHWDGTLASSAAILNSIFGPDTHAFFEDNQDMSMTIGISGRVPSAVFLALLAGGYIPLKPEGVRVNFTLVTTADGEPLFGLDMDNQYVAGLDRGAWGVPA